MNTTSHDNLIYSLAFSYSKIIGPRTFDKLLKKFGNPTAAYHASTKYLEKIIGLNKTKKFEKFREIYKADSTLFALNKKNIQILILQNYWPSNI
jgi:predicted Rossmann fold nucleotide-binding protein DprA/Smf involved in DNA uptake